MRLSPVAAALTAALALSGCDQQQLSPSAERGRQVYLAQCSACHATDPAQPGPLGPPLKGTTRAVLEAKLLKGEYPPGYAPKRPTKVMAPLPALAGDIPALADYLR